MEGERIHYFFQIDDNILLLIKSSNVELVEVKDKNIDLLQSFDTYSLTIFGPLDKKILFHESNSYNKEHIIKAYIYENKKLKFEKEKPMNSMKNIEVDYRKNSYCIINKKEIGISYCEKGLLFYNYYIGFFDLEKDKKIHSFGVEKDTILSLINKDILIYTIGSKIYPVHLKNHSRKKEIKLEDGNINSILVLNEKKFLVGQFYVIKQFELGKDNKLELISSMEFRNTQFDNLYMYPNNRYLTLYNDKAHDDADNYIRLYYSDLDDENK